MRRVGEPPQCRVAAKERVDGVEGVGVVTVVGAPGEEPVSYTHLRAHETVLDLVCRLLLEKKKTDNRYN